MSEYQYYEFRAIDKPLDDKAMAELRNISSRAEITPSGLTNEYEWGDFKGDPEKLMHKYFDAFLYFANWGTHQLMFRVPRDCLDERSIKPYRVDHLVCASESKDFTVVERASAPECQDDEWRDWNLGSLIALRHDLIAGDRRCLYLGWLAAVENHEVDDDVLEPPVPPGLRELSGPLNDLAEFLYLSEAMIEIAAHSSPPAPAGPSRDDAAVWIRELPQAQKDRWLVQLLDGKGAALSSELSTAFHRSRKATVLDVPPQRRRAGELREQFEAIARQRERTEAERAAQVQKEREEKLAAERARHLDSLIGKEEQLWRNADKLAATKQPRSYDKAIALLKDLRDLAARDDSLEFSRSLREFAARHSAKYSLVDRLQKAGFDW